MTSHQSSNSTSQSTDISRQLLMKFGPATPSTSKPIESSSSFSFNAPCSSSANKASEERRNRKQKLMEKMKSKRQQPILIEPTTPEPETTPELDENDMKKQKRLLRNRQAAQQSRERKKQKQGELEETINTVLEENSCLKLRIKHLEELLKSSIPANENTVLPVDYSFLASTPSISSSGDSYEYSMQEAQAPYLTHSSELQLRLAGDELDSFIEEASSPSSSESFFSSQPSPNLEIDESNQHCTTLQNDSIQLHHEALESRIVSGLGFSLEDEEAVQQTLLSSSGEPAVLNRNSLQLEELERLSYGQQRQEAALIPSLNSGSILATILVMISLYLNSALQNATLSVLASELFSQKKNSQFGNPSISCTETSPSVAWTQASSPNSRRKKGRWKVAVTFPSVREPSPAMVAWNQSPLTIALITPVA